MKSHFLTFLVACCIVIALAQPDGARAQNSDQLTVRGIRLTAKCETLEGTFATIEASGLPMVKDDTRFKPCAVRHDGRIHPVRFMRMGGGLKDLISIEFDSNGNVREVQAMTVWFFDGALVPPEIKTIHATLLQKYGQMSVYGQWKSGPFPWPGGEQSTSFTDGMAWQYPAANAATRETMAFLTSNEYESSVRSLQGAVVDARVDELFEKGVAVSRSLELSLRRVVNSPPTNADVKL